MRRTLDLILRGLNTEGRSPEEIRSQAIWTAIEHDLDWEHIVLLVDELERMTGLQLHTSPQEASA